MKVTFKQFNQAMNLVEDLKLDDEVQITDGPHKGKDGFVNKTEEDDGKVVKVEVQFTDDNDEEQFVWLKPNQVRKIKSDLDEAKLDEIFGFFKNDDKLAKAKAEREKLQKQLGAAKYALLVKQKNLQMKKAHDAANAPAKKPQKDVRSASGARAAERDWVSSMQNEGVEVFEGRDIQSSVHKEIDELAKLGAVSKKIAEKAKKLATKKECKEADGNGMSVSDAADMFIDLARVS